MPFNKNVVSEMRIKIADRTDEITSDLYKTYEIGANAKNILVVDNNAQEKALDAVLAEMKAKIDEGGGGGSSADLLWNDL